MKIILFSVVAMATMSTLSFAGANSFLASSLDINSQAVTVVPHISFNLVSR